MDSARCIAADRGGSGIVGILNRERELGCLDSRYRRPGAEIAVIYGRRRVGKTALVFEWSKDKRRAFFPHRSPRELVDTFAVLGGTPHYLISVDREASLMQNIEQDVLSPAGSLFDEPRLQLHEELRGDVENYMRVLGAIARGAHQRSDIATTSGLGDANRAGWYLGTLVELGLVEHRQPVSRVSKRRRWGTYHLRDPFFRFWHRWVLPRRNYLEIGQGQRETLDQIRQNMSYIVAPVWEEIARAYLYTASARSEIPVLIEEVGSWWSRDTQIDVVAVNRAERRVIFGEAKWQRATVTEADLDKLVNRGLRWLDGDTYWDVHYAFFAREFGRISDSAASDPRIHLYTPEDVVGGG